MPLTTDGNAPNSVLNEYDILTSYDAGLGQDAGYGSLKKRSVAKEVALYKPYDNTIDTFIQLFGGFDVVSNYKHEWNVKDDLLPDEATGLATGVPDQADIVNNTGGATGYTPTNLAKFYMSAEDGRIFREGDRIRYVGADGSYTFAYTKDVVNVDTSKTYLVIQSFDGTNLQVAGSSDAVIHRMDALRGGDRNYKPQPRGKISKQDWTLIRKIVHDTGYTPRSANTDHYIDFLMEQEADLFKELRRSRTIGTIYGDDDTITLDNGDQLHSSAGLWTRMSNKNLHSLNAGGATFDPSAFKDSIYDLFEFAFGAESGGPDVRQCFVSGKFASYLSRAFEDKQQFYGNEFVAGVRTMRFEHNLGVIDFVHEPIFEYKHPLVGGSLREGAGKAVGMLLPVEQCTERLVFKNEGPSSETFRENGGDEEEIMRAKTTEGLKTTLLNYTVAIEEA
ncbi:hypothetical protein ACKGJO_06590 [Gracilimonas sp. Q87]|uniref:SU10 major capsid protein n=1 Tax=Gracilimonas sp. Q87 TaxID=3384766 RepID=UPI00398450AB